MARGVLIALGSFFSHDPNRLDTPVGSAGMIVWIREAMARSRKTAVLRCNASIIARLIAQDGAGGQAFFPTSRIISHQTMAALVLLLLCSGCSGDPGERLQSGRVLPWMGLQGRWAGTITPTLPACGPLTTGLMSIGPKTFAFDPFQSTTVIQGDIDPAGHLRGALGRAGPGHDEIGIEFIGSGQRAVDGVETINGTLSSGRCEWTVSLHRG